MMPTKKVLAAARSFLHFIWDTLYCTDWRRPALCWPHKPPWKLVCPHSFSHPLAVVLLMVPLACSPPWIETSASWCSRQSSPDYTPEFGSSPLWLTQPSCTYHTSSPLDLFPRRRKWKQFQFSVLFSVFFSSAFTLPSLIRRLKECYPMSRSILKEIDTLNRKVTKDVTVTKTWVFLYSVDMEASLYVLLSLFTYIFLLPSCSMCVF